MVSLAQSVPFRSGFFVVLWGVFVFVLFWTVMDIEKETACTHECNLHLCVHMCSIFSRWKET